jgi:hypothetical protein
MAKTKISAQDIVALSKKEGFLAKQLYVVFTTPTKGIELVMKVIKEHLEFQVALEKKESSLPRAQTGRTTRSRGKGTAWL